MNELSKEMQPFTNEDLDKHEIQLEDYPDAIPTYETMKRYIHQIRQQTQEINTLKAEKETCMESISALMMERSESAKERENIRNQLREAVEALEYIADDDNAFENLPLYAQKALSRIQGKGTAQ